MKCEKCGYELNNWNAFCPSCGAEAPASSAITNSSTQSAAKTTYSGGGVSSFTKLSLLFWIGMLVLSVVNFNFFPRFNINIGGGIFINAGLNALCAIALIFGAMLSVRNDRIETMVFPMGFYLFISFASLFLLGRFANWLYLGYFALVAIVIFVFFICAQRGTSMRPVTVVSILFAVIWCLIVVIGSPIYYAHFYRIPRGAMNGVMFLFSSSTIKDLLFFGGTSLLGFQTATNRQ